MGNISSSIHNNIKFIYHNNNTQDNHQELIKAEKIDNYLYFCSLNELNKKARENLQYAPTQFSEREKNYIHSFFNEINIHIPIKLRVDIKEVKIIPLMPTADGGMPHTRPNNIICYGNVNQIYSLNTLIHELWHIHQRNFKEEWAKILESIGWKEWSGVLPDKLKDKYRLNPDTVDSPLWIYNNTWVPLPIFKDISTPKIGEVNIWCYNVKTGQYVTSIPKEMKERFSDKLPDVAFEHPREIAAYLLSDRDKFNETQGFKELVKAMGHISIMSE